MIDTGDLRKGLTIELDGNLYNIVDWEHNKTGRGGAVVKLKMRDVRAGHIIERSWPAGSKFQRARVERQPATFQYVDGDIFYFMNKEILRDHRRQPRPRRRQRQLPQGQRGVPASLTYGEEAISVELPAAVVLTVAETEPGLRGDTAQGGTKPAKMETGLVVNVPLFVNTGDKLKVDTRSGAYLERAN